MNHSAVRVIEKKNILKEYFYPNAGNYYSIYSPIFFYLFLYSFLFKQNDTQDQKYFNMETKIFSKIASQGS